MFPGSALERICAFHTKLSLKKLPVAIIIKVLIILIQNQSLRLIDFPVLTDDLVLLLRCKDG